MGDHGRGHGDQARTAEVRGSLASSVFSFGPGVGGQFGSGGMIGGGGGLEVSIGPSYGCDGFAGPMQQNGVINGFS